MHDRRSAHQQYKYCLPTFGCCPVLGHDRVTPWDPGRFAVDSRCPGGQWDGMDHAHGKARNLSPVFGGKAFTTSQLCAREKKTPCDNSDTSSPLLECISLGRRGPHAAANCCGLAQGKPQCVFAWRFFFHPFFIGMRNGLSIIVGSRLSWRIHPPTKVDKSARTFSCPNKSAAARVLTWVDERSPFKLSIFGVAIVQRAEGRLEPLS
ncbi:unnamed protein product [Periconia digitata]|uniref:Uncharacterized protein n=1 Tax=Periconia digitata TaxID=1303443 RepID=A0A9W4XQ83_9PLEO|nr:unnamed protein product [Periconia digitata]